MGSGREYLAISLDYLLPAAPGSKNHQCLVVSGPLAGGVHGFKSVSVKAKTAVLDDGSSIHFSDIVRVESAT